MKINRIMSRAFTILPVATLILAGSAMASICRAGGGGAPVLTEFTSREGPALNGPWPEARAASRDFASLVARPA